MVRGRSQRAAARAAVDLRGNPQVEAAMRRSVSIFGCWSVGSGRRPRRTDWGAGAGLVVRDRSGGETRRLARVRCRSSPAGSLTSVDPYPLRPEGLVHVASVEGHGAGSREPNPKGVSG
jgi:hypothetical protein